MKELKSMTNVEALFLLIAGFILGTVFTFGMHYWNVPITQEESIHATAVFSSYKEQLEKGDVKEIIVRFENYDQLYIDGVCVNSELRDRLHSIAPGTEVSLIVHPNSNTILNFQIGDSVLMDFHSTSEKLAGEATGFMVLGLFCYALSVFGLFGLLFRKKR